MRSSPSDPRPPEGTDPSPPDAAPRGRRRVVERPVEAPLERAAENALEQLIEDTTLPETRAHPLAAGDALRGKVAIVTGGSRGIGRAVATALAGAGVDIAFNFLDDGGASRAEAQEVARQLRQMEVRVVVEPCDVRESGDVRAFVRQVIAELGGLHIVVNNAGASLDRALWKMSDHEWEAVVRTHLDGAFNILRATTPHLRAQEWGKVVNITSVHGIRPAFGVANHVASKAGLIGLTRAAAMELGPSNINVNAVAPGYIRTPSLTARVPAEILDRAREQSALGRLGDPSDVAQVVLFLCSEAARHITGVVLPVDGGFLL